jgi:hypothetical protein
MAFPPLFPTFCHSTDKGRRGQAGFSNHDNDLHGFLVTENSTDNCLYFQKVMKLTEGRLSEGGGKKPRCHNSPLA